MPAPIPQLKSNKVIDEVTSIIQSATAYLSPDEVVIRRLLREAEDAIKATPAGGHAALACVYQLVGDVERATHHIDNAVRLSGDLVWKVNRSSILANLGLASDALVSYRTVVRPENGWMKFVWNHGYCIGAFLAMRDAVLSATRLQIDVNELETTTAIRAAAILEKLGLTDADAALILDAAGEVLRANRLFFLGSAPRVDVWDGDGRMPFIKIAFRTAVSPQSAHKMYLELVDRILERSPKAHGAVSVEFEGATANNERKAA